MSKEWQIDIGRGKSLLRQGQILIVSVTGTTREEDKSFDYLVNDYVKAAVMARDAGAEIVELNLSCPNVKGDRAGDLYRYPGRPRLLLKPSGKKPFLKDRSPCQFKEVICQKIH